MLDRPAADVFELERIGVIGALVAHGSDQARPTLPGQGKDREEISLVKVDMQFAVERRAGSFNVGDIEDLPIGAAGKACTDRLAHDRAGAVAAGDVACLAGFLPALRPAKAGDHVLALVREADQFGPALNRDAELLQPLDQQPLMLVLRKDLQERIGRQVRTDALKRQARRRFALHPQIDGGNLVPMFDDGVGEAELAVEFERPRLNRQGPRGRAGLRRLVDDAHLNPELG